MPQQGPFTTNSGGGGGGTATFKTSHTITTPPTDGPSGTTTASLLDNQSTAVGFAGNLGPHRNIGVQFPAGYLGNIVATDADDETLTETILNPGAGGGTVWGTKIFNRVIGSGLTRTGGAGSGHTAIIMNGTRLGLPHDNIASIDRVFDSFLGTELDIVARSTSERWVDVGTVTGDTLEVDLTLAVPVS